MTVLLQRFLVFDMLAGATELGTRAGACPTTIEQAHGILIAPRTFHCPSLALGLFFFLHSDPEIKAPPILFYFDELATAPIDTGRIAEILRLALTPLGVGVGLIPTHEIYMIGLTICDALPFSDFFEDF
jgi:hypothetical protein